MMVVSSSYRIQLMLMVMMNWTKPTTDGSYWFFISSHLFFKRNCCLSSTSIYIYIYRVIWFIVSVFRVSLIDDGPVSFLNPAWTIQSFIEYRYDGREYRSYRFTKYIILDRPNYRYNQHRPPLWNRNRAIISTFHPILLFFFVFSFLSKIRRA